MSFKYGDRVQVAKDSSGYGGKYNCCTGTVAFIVGDDVIGVLLDEKWNSASNRGYFYFSKSNLTTIYPKLPILDEKTEDRFAVNKAYL